ncbi:MAG: FecR domain-containing protein [Spirochaetales bacterium]|nr:FecR domain-containing protein [Spirochaetales bacterium]
MRTLFIRRILESEWVRGGADPGADWKTLLRINVFPVGGVLVALAALVLLFVELGGGGAESGSPVGTVHFKTGEARRKGQARAVWTDISVSFPVYNFDTIWTQDGAEAVLRLENENEIELGENTMVVLRLDPGQLQIDLGGGSVRSKQKQGSGEIEIKAGEKIISATEDLRVVAGGDSVEVDVRSGQATLKSGEEEGQVLSGGSVAVMKGDLPATVHRTLKLLKAPLDGAQLYPGRVNFSWESLPGPMEFQVASDAGFQRVVGRSAANGGQGGISLGEGVYYWRLLSPDGNRSEVRRLVIASPAPLTAVSPAAGQALMAKPGKNAVVVFRFSGCTSFCELRLAENRDLHNARKQAVTGQSLSLALRPGRYFWQIGRDDLSTGQESPVESFSIIEETFPEVPELLEPAQAAKLSSEELAAGRVHLRWSKTQSGQGYEVQLRGLSGYERIYPTDALQLQLKVELLPGTYEWRVRNVGGTYSSPRSFTVSGPGIELLLPENESWVSATVQPRTVAFFWEQKENRNYRLLVARDPAFRDLLPQTGHTRQLPEEGSYYWKVQQLDSAGSVMGESASRTIHYYSEPGALTILSPGIRPIDMTSRSAVHFSWTQAPGATHYRLRLYSGGGRLLLERYLPSPAFSLRNLGLLAGGFLIWEVTPLRRLEKRILEGPPSRSRLIVYHQKIAPPDFRVEGDGILRENQRP